MHPASRAARVLTGATVASIGIALNGYSAFGWGALFVLQEGVTETTGVPFGGSVVAVGVAMFVVATALGERPGPGTLGTIVLIGIFSDGFGRAVPADGPVLLRSLALAVSPLVMSLGSTISYSARLGIEPLGSLMFAVHRHVPLSLRTVRLLLEAAMALVGWVLGGVVGVGCVVIGLAIGPCVQGWLRVLGIEPAGAGRDGPEPVPTIEPAPASGQRGELAAPLAGQR